MTPKRRPNKPQRLPLVSSNQALAAFRRLGFEEGPSRGGSHVAMHRDRDDGGKDVIVIVLGQNPIPRGTLDGILKMGNIPRDEFLRSLGRRR